MTRTEVLRDLLDNGRGHDPQRLAEAAAELGLPLADILVVAGHPVPGHLLPPDRGTDVMREFTYRVTFCDHPQMAALCDFLAALPDEGVAPGTRPARELTDPDPFPAILDGLMRNRGFDVMSFPFVGLSRSTIHGMLGGKWHWLSQLQAVAGPLGWNRDDLATLAGTKVRPLDHGPMFCRHLGAVFLAAVPRTTGQLMDAAREAFRLGGRRNRGAWRPVSQGTHCPDG
jgi:hypothetical protein